MGRKRTCSWCGPGDQSGPNNGFYYLCEECYDEWDFYMHIGKKAVEAMDMTHPGAYWSEMKRTIENNRDLHRRFKNLRTIAKAMDKGDYGPLVEGLPKSYAIEKFPEFFDENGKCKSEALTKKEGESHV